MKPVIAAPLAPVLLAKELSGRLPRDKELSARVLRAFHACALICVSWRTRARPPVRT
jgi:hypothetical protein